MNRRKLIKKDYFAIFSSVSGRGLVWAAFFIIAVVIVTWIMRSTDNSSSIGTAMASEDIVALLAVVIIPLALIFATLIAFEKITGFTLISGVEWVGKNTLAIIAWGINNIQNGLGFEAKKSNHRVAANSRQRTRVKQPPEKQVDVRTALLDTEIVPDLDTEPVFSDFQSSAKEPSSAEFGFSTAEAEFKTEAKDSLIVDRTDTLLQSDTAVIAPESPGSETEDVVNVDTNPLPAIESTRQSDKLEYAYDEFETELKTFFPDQQDLTTTETTDHSAYIEPSEIEETFSEEISATLNTDTLQQESDDLIQGLDASKGAILNSIDHNEVFNSTELDADLQLQQEDLAADTFKPDSLANDSDFISRALQAAQNDALHTIDNSEAGTQLPLESSQDVEQQGISDAVASVPKEPDFMIKALQAAKDKQNQSNEQISESESTESHRSLFDQAEQTAANIISSFSQRFSKSFNLEQKPATFQLPSIELLQQHQQSIHAYTSDELDTMSRSVERVLNDYKVSVEVVGAYPGPIITRFELSLAPGIKVSRVSGLAKDLARAMLVTSVRVVEIIEGTPYIGLEIPNQERELVSFREIIASAQFQQAKSPLTLALGKDVSGQTVVSDLAKMPHLLVAGTTGSGKSVAINTMILSMLYKATPDQVRMIMVDPKMLELSIYEGIPHLLTPVVTDMKEAQNALRWAVAEMERRYKLMSKVGVRNLAGFNQKITDAEARGETIRDPLFELIEPLAEGESFPVLTTLPSIVIVIDELADMMMIVGKKVEELIARLAQKARAAGIHLILATQRPSVDVLTGLIKANVPTRISFQVSSRIDSRTILDQGGAEALLGNGDMLFLPSGTSVPTRSHGAFVDDHEVHAVVDYLKSLGKTSYLSDIIREEPAENIAFAESALDEVDALYNHAVSFVLETGRASISSVQRRFKVGYNRAARMIDQMEDENIVSEPEGNGSRRVLDRE